MKFYTIEPEVAGGWGKNTVFERSPGKPTIVHKLHYQFDGWLGDELVESTPCFIVSQQLADRIQKSQLTGISFDVVDVTCSSQFHELFGDRQLPNFLWLKIQGKPGREDFGLTEKLRLVISDRALSVLQGSVSHADILEFTSH